MNGQIFLTAADRAFTNTPLFELHDEQESINHSFSFDKIQITAGEINKDTGVPSIKAEIQEKWVKNQGTSQENPGEPNN